MSDPCTCCERLSRRRVLKGVGATAVLGISATSLASCSNADEEPETAATETLVANVNDVPVGVGKSFTVQGTTVLISQPRAGEFLAFSSVCTHEGCVVGEDEKNFLCPCHGSGFSFENGRAMFGPAREPLEQFALRVEGNDIYVSL